jgi:hypothetical protein
LRQAQSLENDGYRAFLARWADGRVLIRSRGGTDMTAAFPEITEAARMLPPNIGDLLFDGELVIWHGGRLAFERLQPRLGAKPATARRLAAMDPASFQVFDVLHVDDESLMGRPYRERRAVLEALFAELKLGSPWNLCPATTDPETIGRWLTEWVEKYGIEGVVWKTSTAPTGPGTAAQIPDPIQHRSRHRRHHRQSPEPGDPAAGAVRRGRAAAVCRTHHPAHPESRRRSRTPTRSRRRRAPMARAPATAALEPTQPRRHHPRSADRGRRVHRRPSP